MKFRFPCFALSSSLLLSLAFGPALPHAAAEVVAEWKFDAKSDSPSGSTVKLDKSNSGASDESHLSDNASVSAKTTAITNHWKAFLATGYLEAKAGGGIPETGITEINKYGLFTQANPADSKNASYGKYFGFSGLGDGKNRGGTFYLVLSPLDKFDEKVRYGFMGTGHVGEGQVQLGIVNGEELQLRVGAAEIISTKLKRKWKPKAWYFIGASWSAGVEPLLYVREMGDNGEFSSPAGTMGTPEGVTDEPVAPKYDPLVIGAHWYNPGSNPSSVYGAGARIAYARFENVYSKKSDFEAAFKALGAP